MGFKLKGFVETDIQGDQIASADLIIREKNGSVRVWIAIFA